jgi:hypothetical protein
MAAKEVRPMRYNPYHYQEYAEQFILDHNGAGLLLDMGLG